MKKILFAAMAATILFASCAKEQGGDAASENKVLSVKITNSTLKSRAVEAPAIDATNTIELVDGVIFIVGSTGAVTAAEAIEIGTGTNGIASATGQQLTSPVTADSRVYIVANVGAANVTAWTTTATIPANLTAINSLVLGIAAANVNSTDYKKATLANSTADAVAITLGTGADEGKATVTVPINPVYSRMELVKVSTSSANITSFKVKAVYVEDYYSSYTIGGSYSGAIYKMNQGGATSVGTANALMSDVHATPIASVSNEVVPEAGKSWVYHVPSGNLPRLIIELTDVVAPGYTTAGTTYYLTVNGYTSGPAAFERGKVYRIGAGAGIEFDEDDISITPNPVDVDLFVKVSISEWEIEDLNPEL